MSDSLTLNHSKKIIMLQYVLLDPKHELRRTISKFSKGRENVLRNRVRSMNVHAGLF